MICVLEIEFSMDHLDEQMQNMCLNGKLYFGRTHCISLILYMWRCLPKFVHVLLLFPELTRAWSGHQVQF